MVCLLIMSVSLITTIATDPDYDIERVNEMIDTVPNNDLPLYIYEYEVFLLPTSIKKTSPGPDKLASYWFFRYAAAELTPVVTHLIRLTLSNGTPPEAWKRAVVTPVGLPLRIYLPSIISCKSPSCLKAWPIHRCFLCQVEFSNCLSSFFSPENFIICNFFNPAGSFRFPLYPHFEGF